jgi:hypothetical protein
VKRLHRQKPKGGRMSLRAISAELEARGFSMRTAAHSFLRRTSTRMHMRRMLVCLACEQNRAGRRIGYVCLY